VHKARNPMPQILFRTPLQTACSGSWDLRTFLAITSRELRYLAVHRALRLICRLSGYPIYYPPPRLSTPPQPHPNPLIAQIPS
jgi:hypothetical protein